ILDVVVEHGASEPRSAAAGLLPTDLEIRRALGPQVRVRRRGTEARAVELEERREAPAVGNAGMHLAAVVVAIDDGRLPVGRVAAAFRTLVENVRRRGVVVVIAEFLGLRDLIFVVAGARDDVERVAEMKRVLDRDRPRVLSLL